MSTSLTPDQRSTVTVLLQAGSTIKEISKLANIEVQDVTEAARNLDLTPEDTTERRAKELFGSPDGLSYADVATRLEQENLTNDGKAVHYLTVATWVANHGWAWGGAPDGDYAPDKASSSPSKSKYTLRMSKAMADDVNSAAAISAAADAAWQALSDEKTLVVAVAVVQGAAAAGVTDLTAVKSELMTSHGETIRTTKA